MIKTPYLIQRGKIKLPLVDAGERVFTAVNLEYMGSAEYEFGALPKSLLRFKSFLTEENIRTLDNIQEDGNSLKVISILNDADFAEYASHLEKLRSRKTSYQYHTKEASRFNEDYKSIGGSPKTDFWWDIENDVMFTFNAEFANLLISFIANNIRYLGKL